MKTRVINKNLLRNLVQKRLFLHQYPEISGAEEETAAKVVAWLKALPNIKIIKGIGGTGVIGIFDSGIEGPSLMFRAELDALPIREINTFAHRSKIEHVSHKCGHDGHTIILLGLAKLLSQNPPKRGKVTVLFQPAEETGEGAQAMLKDTKFKDFHFDYVFAFHNLPGFPTHQIIVKEGTFNASVRSLIIRLKGKTAHAAEPENGISPALAVSDMLQHFKQLTILEPERKDFKLITPIYIKMGEIAYGVSAGDADLRFTIRTWTKEEMEEKLIPNILKIIENIANQYGLKWEIEWTNNFRATSNNPKAVSLIKAAAKTNNFNLLEKSSPFKWGEDFGLFTQRFSGAMFGIGVGKNWSALHNPDYDFNDEIIETGLRMFLNILEKLSI